MKKSSFPLIFFCAIIGSAQNIYRTACQGNIARLDSLLKDTSINTQDQRGRSLLHWAIACNRSNVFEHVLEKGINPNLKDKEGVKALFMAVRFQNMSFFDRLVSLQSDSNWKTKQGGLLYEKAILNHDLSFVKKLKEIGVPLDVRGSKKSTPLEIALRIQADTIANWLKKNGANESLIRTFSPEGPYLGEIPPRDASKIFAPNFISTEEYEFGSIFNKAGDEFYYAVDLGGRNVIRCTSLEDGVWSDPVTILSHERYGYNDPFLSPDENRLYFISNQALDGEGETKDIDIWYVKKEGKGWSKPINAGPQINSEKEEYYISFSTNGTMYFASNKNQSHHDIYYSKFVDGEFQEAVKLNETVNTDAYEADVFIDPEEKYLIFCSQREQGLGRGDLYISYKQKDGTWSPSVNMGNSINTEGHELCPFVTADGKYLFYTSKQDIYWVSAEIIERLR
ncbi:MAG: ankyrin repeat domain-containing protein [Croceivirga sp.]